MSEKKRDRAMTSLVYLAGALFDLRQLAGNALLGRVLERASKGRYVARLPQNEEPPLEDAKAIRDADFAALCSCDAAVFQFDGAELDSGTVAEFMAAKFLDLPAVILRSDFRRGGDRNVEPWNLMCSFHPRTEVVVADGMALYASRLSAAADSVEAAEQATDELARRVVAALDTARTQAPVPVDGGAPRVAQLKALLGVAR